MWVDLWLIESFMDSNLHKYNYQFGKWFTCVFLEDLFEMVSNPNASVADAQRKQKIYFELLQHNHILFDCAINNVDTVVCGIKALSWPWFIANCR